MAVAAMLEIQVHGKTNGQLPPYFDENWYTD
jgi:hypothetical protein